MNAKSSKITVYGRAARISFVLICAAYIAGCSAAPIPAAETANDAKATIKVEKVAKQSMGEPREQIAEVSASTRTEIVADAGGKLLKLAKRNGELVKAGDVIAEFESKNGKLERESAKARLIADEALLEKTRLEVSSTQVTLTNTIKDLENELKLQIAQGASEADIDKTKRSRQAAVQQLNILNSGKSLASLEANVATSRLALEQAEKAWNGGQIVAPANGVLTDVNADIGMSIQQGSMFGIVQNTDKVKMKAQLTRSAVELVGNKKELTYIDSNGKGKPKKAKVVYLAGIPDASTKLYSLELEADNADGALKPASRVRIQLTTSEEENVVAVPTLSILKEGTDAFVFVLNGNKASKRKIELGRVNGSYQEVLGGVAAGESIIVSGQHALKEGQTVEQ
ncbi:efflux RND transporter periplasmic adaptor subunit [Cohnella soli]|uniref:Efflux RND transporter periplasmic adaptor subunit n=1 Tax=Cohnella soli TaxID=425005 RepID=A0ABW0HUC6_9BACL